MGFRHRSKENICCPFGRGADAGEAICSRSGDSRHRASGTGRPFCRELQGMSQPVANCPNCGAKIVFRWSSSVQTVCEFCKSILIRTDLDLQKVGQVADLPPDSSPIQINTEGKYGNKAFVVVGRILYEYDQGGWNEWHVMMNDGTSAWLSDAQSEYALSRSSKSQNLPTLAMDHVGQQFTWSNQRYTVSVITAAHYRSVEP